MSKALLERAAAIKKHNKAIEKIPYQNGYHDESKDHAGRYCAPQRNGLPRISEHLVPFHAEDAVTFVGDDARRAAAACAEWAKNQAGRSPFEMTGTEQKLIAKYLPKLKLVQGDDGVPTFTIPAGWWNDLLWLFDKTFIGLTGATAERPEQDPGYEPPEAAPQK